MSIDCWLDDPVVPREPIKRIKGRSITDRIHDYTVIDIETTGGFTDCEIIELAAVRVRNDKITDTFSQLVKASEPLPPFIVNLTGIDDAMLADAPPIADVLPRFLDFVGNDVLLGHNVASFDSNIIYDNCAKLGLRRFDNDMLDTLRYVRRCDTGSPDNKLTTLTAYYKIDHENAHRALADCIANHKLYQIIRDMYNGTEKKCIADNDT